MIHRLLILIVIAVQGACSGGEGEVDAALQEIEVGSGTEVLPVGLTALGGSGVTGQVTLVGEGDQTRINVTIVGLDAQTQVRGSVHSGPCVSPDTAAAALADFGPVDLDPYGTLTTAIGLSLDRLQSSRHAIMLIGGASPTPIACAEVTPPGS